ncbi:hypothetical protein KTD31_00040 [Burkholderia multivorans]|jgi:hypothetical protein|uniref:hypothetical protein n=1 Tax=Burkholderia multivorans TaxID=87883 RepID=UPI001C223351|nr:hypothetical protein [Burkholderia multivorans]MBU9199787.1 hypothetical protein [Burkholderia multivorans]MDN8079094.1 hypothetical protein [Burkholderia multivorans]
MQNQMYVMENGEYVIVGLGPRIVVGPEVAILFDRQSNCILKHGKPEFVQAYADASRARLIEEGFSALAEDLVCLEGAFDLEELNKVFVTADYISRFHANMASSSAIAET